MKPSADLPHCMQDYLVKWPKTLMVVSHARDFLNVVCTDVLHLHSRKLTSYKGDFDTFERTATERLKNAKKAAEGHERQRAHMQVQTTPGTALMCRQVPFNWHCTCRYRLFWSCSSAVVDDVHHHHLLFMQSASRFATCAVSST